MKPQYVSLALLIIFSVMLSNCQDRKIAQEQEGISIVDDLGRTVSLPGQVRRLVSLAPSITETVFFLGFDSMLVGVSDFCDYPPTVTAKERVGGMINPNIEKVLQLKPDVVLITVEGNTKESFERLESAGLKVFVTNPRGIDGVLHTIESVNSICGGGSGAKRAMDSLRNIVQESARRAESRTSLSILMLVSLDPLIAAGDSSHIGGMLRAIKMRNAAGGIRAAYPVMSREAILRADPDVILVPSDVSPDAEYLCSRFPEWKRMQSVLNHHVYAVDPNLFLRPGPRTFEALLTLESLTSLTGR
jgi:iron complex transport system substrate-binding protein